MLCAPSTAFSPISWHFITQFKHNTFEAEYLSYLIISIPSLLTSNSIIQVVTSTEILTFHHNLFLNLRYSFNIIYGLFKIWCMYSSHHNGGNHVSDSLFRPWLLFNVVLKMIFTNFTICFPVLGIKYKLRHK